MRDYIIRRLLVLIPTLLLISFLIFFVVHLIPGDAIDAMQARSPDTQLDRAKLERELGLDAPLIIQYLRWMRTLKKCGCQIQITESPQPFGQSRDIRFRNHLPVHTNPLPKLDKMR